MDLLLRWNPDYFKLLCLETFFAAPDLCKRGFSAMDKSLQIILRGSALRKIGTEAEIDLLAAALAASVRQVNALVQGAAEAMSEPGSTYEDMWKFTIANYHSGSGCLQNALRVASALGFPLTWENVRHYFSGECKRAEDYVERVYAYGNAD